jgi:hypothetical protein
MITEGWTPAAVTRMLFRIASLAAVFYMIVIEGMDTESAVAIAGVLAATGAQLVPGKEDADYIDVDDDELEAVEDLLADLGKRRDELVDKE